MQHDTPTLPAFDPAPAPPAPPAPPRHTGRWIVIAAVIVGAAVLAGGSHNPAPAGAAGAAAVAADPASAAAASCVDIEVAIGHADDLTAEMEAGADAADRGDIAGAGAALDRASDDAYALAADYASEPEQAALWLDIAGEFAASSQDIGSMNVTGATTHLLTATDLIGRATDLLDTDPPAVC